MARFVDRELPEDLYRRLDGSGLEAHADKAIMICTVDSNGWPHPAMLSYFEVIARDRRQIRLATYSDSTTTNNMRRNGRLTLMVIDNRIVYYIKGKVQELQRGLKCAPGISKLNLEVDQVLADHTDENLEADAYVTGGITYSNPNLSAEQARAKELLRELLE